MAPGMAHYPSAYPPDVNIRHTFSPGSDMEKANTIITSLKLLEASTKEDIWLYALSSYLMEHGMVLADYNTLRTMKDDVDRIKQALSSFHAATGNGIYNPPPVYIMTTRPNTSLPTT